MINWRISFIKTEAINESIIKARIECQESDINRTVLVKQRVTRVNE